MVWKPRFSINQQILDFIPPLNPSLLRACSFVRELRTDLAPPECFAEEETERRSGRLGMPEFTPPGRW